MGAYEYLLHSVIFDGVCQCVLPYSNEIFLFVDDCVLVRNGRKKSLGIVQYKYNRNSRLRVPFRLLYLNLVGTSTLLYLTYYRLVIVAHNYCTTRVASLLEYSRACMHGTILSLLFYWDTVLFLVARMTRCCHPFFFVPGSENQRSSSHVPKKVYCRFLYYILLLVARPQKSKPNKRIL